MAGEPRTHRRDGASLDRPPQQRADVLVADLAEDDLELLGVMVATDGPVSVEELADRTGQAATTVYRRLQTMAETPLVTRRMAVDSDGLSRPEYETRRAEKEDAVRAALGEDRSGD